VDQRASLAETFVEVADTLVADFDLIDFLNRLCHRSVDLFSVDASGLLLRDARGALHVVAASNEQGRLIELFQLQNSQGPCLDAIQGGTQVHADSTEEISRRWPLFGKRMAGEFASVYALPMRLRSEVVGGLNLFGKSHNALAPAYVRVAQALADTATIGIIQQRTVQEANVLSDQLQTALDSRIVIEQAKGIYAERANVDMTVAWQALRNHSRNHNMRLRDVATAYIGGELELEHDIG
jgi:transcriptional regulator with GAF, ATPase, and Fis domain